MQRWILVLAGLSVWAQQPEATPYSREKAAALGAQLANEVRSHSTAIDNVEVRNYVDRLGQKLAASADAVSYTFSVIADRPVGSTLEATALPGGYIFVSADLILAAQDEAEFAGMLAHAMAHSAAPLAAPHPMTNGAIPLAFVGSWGQNELVPLSSIKIRRAGELEADRKAIGTMESAGYDPNALVRYISRMQPVNDPPFSALPTRADRIAAMQQVIGQLPPKTYSMSEDFARIQDAVRIPPVPPPHAPTLYREGEHVAR